MSFGKRVRLEIKAGNITEPHNDTDSIVNFVYADNIYGRCGIVEAAGDEVKKEYDAKRCGESDMQGAMVWTTKAGSLPYKAIFHVEVPNELPKFDVNVHAALKLAETQGMRSIAFPAMQCTPENKQYIDRYLQVFYEFEKEVHPVCLHMIYIVPSSKEDQDYHDAKTTEMGENLNVKWLLSQLLIQ